MLQVFCAGRGGRRWRAAPRFRSSAACWPVSRWVSHRLPPPIRLYAAEMALSQWRAHWSRPISRGVGGDRSQLVRGLARHAIAPEPHRLRLRSGHILAFRGDVRGRIPIWSAAGDQAEDTPGNPADAGPQSRRPRRPARHPITGAQPEHAGHARGGVPDLGPSGSLRARTDLNGPAGSAELAR